VKFRKGGSPFFATFFNGSILRFVLESVVGMRLAIIVLIQLIPLGSGLVTPLERIGDFTPESKLFNNLVPALTYFGVQNLNVTAKVHVAGAVELNAFCKLSSIDQVSNTFNFNEPTIVLIDYTIDWPGEYCDWQLGDKNVNTGEYWRYWCAIKHAIIVSVFEKDNGMYPGIMGNTNFIRDSPFTMMEHKDNCSYFETRCDTDQDTAFLNSLRNGTMVYMETNESRAELLNRQWAIQVWFRVFVPGLYLSVVYHAGKFLFIRWRTGTLNHTQAKVLILNIVTCCILGIIEALGTRELTTIVPKTVTHFFYAPLIGAGFAGDIWLSSMYTKLNSQGKDSKTQERRIIQLEYLAYIGIMADIALGTAVAYGTNEIRIWVSTFLSLFLVISQIGITSYQIYQTRTAIKSVAESNEHARSEVLRLLQIKLKKCVQVSIVSSVFMVSILIYHSINGIPNNSPGEKYIYWSSTNLAKLGSAFGQTYGCSPISINNKKVYNAPMSKSSPAIRNTTASISGGNI